MNAVSETLSDDELLEYLISHCYRKMLAGKDREEQLHWWTRMGIYVRQRSPARVMEMEREKGLG